MSPAPERVHRTLPRTPESAGFSETLEEWMREAPWIAISAAAHAILLFVLLSIPWDLIRAPEERIIKADLEELPAELPPEEPLPDDPLEVPPGELFEPDPQPAEAADESAFELADERAFPSTVPAPDDFLARDPAATLAEIGFGGGPPPGGKYIGRRRDGKRPSNPVVDRATAWLVAHQSASGAWDADGFSLNCGELGGTVCGGAGSPVHDVGVTGLALLALLGDGFTSEEGPYRDPVRRGIRWLMEAQDPDTGRIGERISHEFLYDHAVATLALCEAYYFSRSPLRLAPAQKAVDFALRARNPYGAWRYEVPPNGESDTSVTGWMVLALTSARDAGLRVDPAALTGALEWLDAMSDPATGRVGYTERGSASSRTPENARFPVDRGEALTAVGLLSRIFLGQRPEDEPMLARHAALLRAKPPVWDPGGGCDMYAWYYGSCAMFQLGGEDWKAWRRALERVLGPSQRTSGDERGSWDPVGPWGAAGGRVYSTALMTLCAEATYRYGRVLGAR